MWRSLVFSASLLCLCAGWTTASAAGKALPGDAEAATHGDAAASHQVVEKVDQPDFVFRQYDLAVLSHYSYMIVSGGEALVVDPDRDTSRYAKDAKSLKAKITRVYLTHSHADFVAGHMELAKATGAEILVNKASAAEFRHTPVADKFEFRFGKVRAVVWTTPGHTPDGTCLLIHHPAESAKPLLVLTGDTLFIGSVGRPDLMEGDHTSAGLASMIYDTWTKKLSAVPDETKLYPAHGAGSLCGAHLSDDPVSTFGEQKKSNPYLQYKGRLSFVTAVIDGLPGAPQYFGHNVAMNRKGPSLVNWSVDMPKSLKPKLVSQMVNLGAWAIDVRDATEFAAGHAPGAVNIALRGRIETWVGIMVPWGEPFVLVGSDDEVRESSFRLHRIGYDNPAGYLQGGMAAWRKAGLPEQKVTVVKPQELYEQMQSGTAPIVIDVRLPKEWMGLRIGKVLNMPINDLAKQARRLEPAMPVLMVCNSAYRSSMAAGVMQKQGFQDVRNLEGGSQAWVEAGLPTYGSERQAQSGASPGVYVNLPERISPRDLAARLMDLPGSLDVVDIRPSWQFNEHHIPAARNVTVADLISSPAYLVDKRPLVIVCRDGAIAAAAGGALVQKAQRPVKFLSGGMVRYYAEVVRPSGVVSDTTSPPPATAPVAAPPAAPAPPPAPAPAPKKRRAGC